VVKVDRRIRWHYTTTKLRLRIGARLTRYRNCKFHNFARTISRHADGVSRYSVPPSAGPLLPLATLVDCCRELFRLMTCVETSVAARCGETASRLVEVLVRSSVQLSPLCTADMTPHTDFALATVTHRHRPPLARTACCVDAGYCYRQQWRGFVCVLV